MILTLLACSSEKQKDYPYRPVPFTAVQITDGFWLPRMETNRKITIPYAFQKCEQTGRIDNFSIAGGLMDGEHKGIYPFDDTDIYKVLEGASYALNIHPDPELDKYMDDLISKVAAAQEADGYLYTARTNKAEHLKNWYGEKRWEKIRGSHELYNAGHLYEAAAAHFEATGKRSLLDIALKNAELVDSVFGPGKLQAPPGHQVIEMGLAKLYRITGEKKFLDLAKFFLDVRGYSFDKREPGGEYNQDHRPVLEQDEAVGHAVRATYMYSGMADVAALTGDRQYIEAIDRIWENVTRKKLYLNGGIGATGSGEAFGGNYELPNMSAYNETCASIGNVYWNHRLFLLHGDAKYIDVMERTLYNGLIAGISMDGKFFFYPNPLESVGQHVRSPWFGCACCPGNVTRFMASVPGYIYTVKDDNIYVNLYAGNSAEINMNGEKVNIIQDTRYPWDGGIKVTIEPENNGRSFTINLRIPGWARNKPVPGDLYRYADESKEEVTLKLNSERQELKIKNGYARITRKWNKGDIVDFNLPMPVRCVLANEKVDADKGRIALERGPLVFCVEWPDVKDGHVRNILFEKNSNLTTEFRKDLLNGVQVINGKGKGYKYGKDGKSIKKEEKEFTAIPYYAWAHRGKGEMTVWLAREESAVSLLHGPTIASTSRVTVSSGKNPEAVNDQLEPENSNDHSVPFFHWWPNKGTEEWVQYDFEKPEEVSTVEVYWFDDTGRGECRIPEFWKILYKAGTEWKPVYTVDKYGVEKDKYIKVVFETVRTGSIKLEIQSRKDFAGGIHELKVK